MYTQLDANGNNVPESEKSEFSFRVGVNGAFATIPENLAGVADTLLDPLGISVGTVDNVEAAAEEQAVSLSTFATMTALFDGRRGAFAYLLFVLLYFPCVAAIAAVYRETNWQWTVFTGAWTTGLAYAASTTFYQVASFTEHPAFSCGWLVLGRHCLSAGRDYAALCRATTRTFSARWSLTACRGI